MNIDYTDFKKLSHSRIINPGILQKVRIGNISIDSRKCKKNDVFFAIVGEKYDGHDFINDVIKKGVNVIVGENKWFSKNKSKIKGFSYVEVPDTTKGLGELASIYRNKFLIPVIAVGGSNGKTATKDFIAHVLSKKYKVLKTTANFNNAYGVPLTLFGLNNEHEIAVVEIGTNHLGEIKYLCDVVKPQFGVLTNIGKEHLKYFKNIKGVMKEEFELIKFLNDNYGTFFLNKDDEVLAGNIKDFKLKIFSFGGTGKNDVKGSIKGFNKFYPKIKISFNGKTIDTTLSMIGKQSFESALCAAAFGFFFEVPADKIKKAISEYKVDSKRRNELKNFKGLWVLDDTYNSNPESVKITLENLKKYKLAGNVHIVLGDMAELGESAKKEHYEIGNLIKKLGFENLYTLGTESYNTFLGAKGVLNNYYFNDKIVLSELLKLSVKKNDLVFVKGSHSMKMEEIVEYLK